MVKTRPEILKQAIDEIMEMIRLQVATEKTIGDVIYSALTDYSITLNHLHDETLKDAHGLED